MPDITNKFNQFYQRLNTSTFLRLGPVAVFLAIALTLIIIDHNKGRAYFDHTHFHLPVITQLINNFDISDYKAATAPGYHLIFASVGQVTGLNVTFFKLINAFITAIFIGYLCIKLSANYRPLKVFLLMLPMVLSVYILPAGVWLLPDNLAWFTVAWVMFQINQNPFTNKQFITIAIVLALAVLIRQTFLWLAAIIWACALVVLLKPTTVHNSLTNVKTDQTTLVKIYILKCIFATIPAVLVLLYLAITWRGLVPPSFQGIHHYISPSAPAFFFALFAVYTTFYLPILIRQNKNKITKNSLYLGAAIGFFSVIFIASSYDIKAGRFGGLWNIVKLFPNIGDKSLLMIVLSIVGGAMFSALMKMLNDKEKLIIIVASIAFVSTMMVNQFVYERYFSGFIYITLILLISQQTAIKDNKSEQRINSNYWIYGGVGAFAVFNALILVRNLSQTF